jgi:predicted DNA-binding transcriptional regulator AlpA
MLRNRRTTSDPGNGAGLASIAYAGIRPHDPTDRLLTAREVAAHIGVNVKRVYELGIPAVHISQRSLRWQRSDVLRWIEERRDEP